ncbi:MAG: polyprenyl synthetase [Nitrospirae bacterium GWC2_42_7]|nr:MAG: polyprenyl synthetase [Nitrospirae bacterium GWC2_42_7]
MDIKKYLNDKKEAVDSFLHAYFKEQRRPALLHEAMLYSLFAGGKRIRPVLAIASYEACGGKSDEIVPYASALEVIHTYSLIHDDLPAMDNDDLRRGKPTSHKVYGETIAILAGDALLTDAFSLLSDTTFCHTIKETDLLKALHEISIASGSMGMVAGQAQDILSENSVPDKNMLQFIHIHKTTAIICASVKLGCILAGGKPEKLEAISSYGMGIGLAFQVVDDILNVEGDTKEMGKAAGSDAKTNKMTYPSLYGIEESRQISKKLISDAIDSLASFSSAADPLREIALYLLNRRN